MGTGSGSPGLAQPKNRRRRAALLYGAEKYPAVCAPRRVDRRGNPVSNRNYVGQLLQNAAHRGADYDRYVQKADHASRQPLWGRFMSSRVGQAQLEPGD